MLQALHLKGWTIVGKLPQDGSARSYARLRNSQGNTALVMACGPLSGGPGDMHVHDYARLSRWLNDIGLRAPEIYEIYEAENMAVIEDFGAVTAKQAILDGHDEAVIYRQAFEILDTLGSRKSWPDVPCFFESHLRKARRRLVDWYIPACRKKANEEGLRESYLAVWDDIESRLTQPETGFVHADYHLENLMLLDDGSLGIIDFQEGLEGPLAYDLVNILECMRTDVPPKIKETALKSRDDNYLAWYRVLGTQFHLRLMGQCIRWAVVDDKTRYMQCLPRLKAYIDTALHDPLLEPVKYWCAAQGLDFMPPKDFNPERIRPFIAEDAI